MNENNDYNFLVNPLSKFFKSLIPKEQKDIEDDLLKTSVSTSEDDLHAYLKYGNLSNKSGGYVSNQISFDQVFRSKADKIKKFREMEDYPTINDALDITSDEAIVKDVDGNIVNLHIDDEEDFPSNIAEQIKEESDYLIKNVFRFQKRGWQLFRRFLVEGEIFLEKIPNKQKDSIIGLKVMPAFKTLPFYESNIIKGFIHETLDPERQYVADDIKLQPNQVAYVCWDGYINGDITDPKSYLWSSIRTYNQLKNLEDSLIVYRLCLHPETRIRTKDGYKYIKDIQIGDYVVTYQKDKTLIYSKVTDQFMNGIKPIIKVSSVHNEILCTVDHPLLVKNKKTEEVSYIKAGEIIPKVHQFINVNNDSFTFEQIPIPRILNNIEEVVKLKDVSIIKDIEINKSEIMRNVSSQFNYKWDRLVQFLYIKGKCIPKLIGEEICRQLNISFDNLIYCNKGEVNPERINLPEFVDEEFARLFGFLIGDGTIGKNCITFAEGVYPELNEYYADILRKYFGTCERHPSKGRKYVNYTTSNTFGRNLLKQMGFFNGSKIKRVPDWLFKCSPEIKKAFILGYADADGCEKHYENTGLKAWEIISVNKNLIEDVKEIWSSLGLSSGKTQNRFSPKRFVHDHWIKDTHSFGIYISEKPLEEFETISKVVEFGDSEVYDITVEHDEHNFIANNVPVHNCRAVEKRVFNVEIGQMPPGKAREFINKLINQYKRNTGYDPVTGNINSSQNLMSFNEDFWFDQRDGKGSTVNTLQSGMNLGELKDIDYFAKKLYQTLKLPKSWWNDDKSPFGDGKNGEISREEIKFDMFVERIQSRFSDLFVDVLLTQLQMKGIDTQWLDPGKFHYKFTKANFFAELKENSLLENRAAILTNFSTMMYSPMNPQGMFSPEFVLKKYFKMTDEEFEENQKLLKKNKIEDPPMNPFGDGMNPDGSPNNDENSSPNQKPKFNDFNDDLSKKKDFGRTVKKPGKKIPKKEDSDQIKEKLLDGETL